MPSFKYKDKNGTETTITLYTEKTSTPSFVVRHNGTDYYASAVAASNAYSSTLKFQWAGTVYFVNKTRGNMTKQILYTSSTSSEQTVSMLDVLGVSYSTGAGNLKLTEVVLLGGGAGGAGGGGSAYNGAYGASGGTGASGGCGSHLTYGTAISLPNSYETVIKYNVGAGGTGGSGGGPVGVGTFKDLSPYTGKTGTSGGVGGITYIVVDGTKLLYALGGAAGYGGNGGYVAGGNTSDTRPVNGSDGLANGKKNSSYSYSGATVVSYSDNMLSTGVNGSTANVKNADGLAALGEATSSTLGQGGGGGTGGTANAVGSGLSKYQSGSGGSSGTAGTNGAIRLSFSWECNQY